MGAEDVRSLDPIYQYILIDFVADYITYPIILCVQMLYHVSNSLFRVQAMCSGAVWEGL